MKKLVAGLATAVVVLVLAPVALARPIEAPGLPKLPAPKSAPATPVAKASAADGFNWGDAAIGASAMAAVIVVGLGGTVGARRVKLGPRRERMPAATGS